MQYEREDSRAIWTTGDHKMHKLLFHCDAARVVILKAPDILLHVRRSTTVANSKNTNVEVCLYIDFL